MFKSKKFIIFGLLTLLFFSSCGNKFGDARNNPTNAQVRAKKMLKKEREQELVALLEEATQTLSLVLQIQCGALHLNC